MRTGIIIMTRFCKYCGNELNEFDECEWCNLSENYEDSLENDDQAPYSDYYTDQYDY
jgi:hypothetical protein